MQLVCRYGGDPADPLLGVVVGDYLDETTLSPADVPRGCVVLGGQLPVDSKVPETGLDVYPRVGEEPGKLGDPPTSTYPSHDELDDEDVPLTVKRVDPSSGAVKERTHPLRAVAGQPYADRRRGPSIDPRPRRAPPQGDPSTLRAYGEWRAAGARAAGVVVGGVRYSSDLAGVHTAEARATRASRDPGFSVRVVSESGVVSSISGQALTDVADAVSDEAERLVAFTADLPGLILSGKVKTFADVDRELGVAT